VVLCTGKVYYDLLKARAEAGVNDIYLLRLEQLYPFPRKALIEELSRFPGAEMVWCQEEPKNMGAWSFVEPRIEEVLGEIGAKHGRARYVGRAEAASVATGLLSRHNREQAALVDEALTIHGEAGRAPARAGARAPAKTAKKAPAKAKTPRAKTKVT